MKLNRERMRALIILVLIVCASLHVTAQEKVRYERKAGIAIGSLRNRYPYPVTDLLFNTGIIKNRVQLYSRLRAMEFAAFSVGTITISAFMAWCLSIFRAHSTGMRVAALN